MARSGRVCIRASGQRKRPEGGDTVGSDTPKPPEDATRVFGLTKAQLWPIVEAAVGEAVALCEISFEHELPRNYGYQAEKAIPTFTCTTKAGAVRRVTVFGKHFYRTGPAESVQYGFLAAHDAPIAQMYGRLYDAENREMLFLEHLDTSPEAQSLQPPGRLRDFLSVTARLNAIRPSPKYRSWLEGWESTCLGWIAGAERDLEGIWEHACRGELGDELRDFCAEGDSKLKQAQSIARRVAARASRMEQGLIHSDLSRENTGRRHATGELLILDIEFVHLGPRFFDIGPYLGGAAGSDPSDPSLRELAQHYLDEYARWGGSAPESDEFLDDLYVMWVAHPLHFLNWRLGRALDGEVTWTKDREEGRRASQRELAKVLATLLQQKV